MKYWLFAGLFFFLLSAVVLGQETTNTDPFLEALKKREAIVKVVDITFKMKEILPKGGPTPAAAMGLEDPKSTKTLDKDLILESTNRVVIQGTMTRFEGNHPVWHLADGKPLPDKRITVSNLNSSKSFYPNGFGGNTEVEGAFSKLSQNRELQRYYIHPITFTFRGLHRNIGADSAHNFKIGARRELVKGKNFVEYKTPENRHGNGTRLLVNPDEDNNVVRIANFANGKLSAQMDISYVKNEICGFSPDSWVHHTYTPAGKMTRRTELSVVSCKLNEPLPEDQFDVTFPPGTKVYDSDKYDYYRVQADGQLRLLSRESEELGMVIPQPGTSWMRRYQYWIVGVVIAIVGLAILVYRRRRVAPLPH